MKVSRFPVRDPRFSALATIAALGLSLALAPPASAEVGWFRGTLDEALGAGRAAHRPVLVEFYRTGCGDCALQDSTFGVKGIADSLAPLVCVRFDLDDLEGRELARRLSVVGSPTMIFMDSAGQEIDRIVGSRYPDEFREDLKRIRSGKGTVPDLLAQIPLHPKDVELNFRLGLKLGDRGDPRADFFLRRVLALDSANASGKADNALMALARNARRDSNYSAAAETFERLLARYPESELADGAFLLLAQCYHALGQVDRAIATLERAIVHSPQDPIAWNQLGWSCADWKVSLDRGLVAARRAVELSKDDPAILDTLAEVYYARGEYALAVATEKRAIEKQPDVQDLRDQLAKFQAAERGTGARK